MKKTKLLVVGAFAAAMAVTFSSCTPKSSGSTAGSSGGSGSGGSGTTTLRVLAYTDLAAPNAQATNARIWGGFEQANPDIKLNREELYNEPFHEKTSSYAASGQLPDVVYLWPAGRSSMLHNNRLLKDLAPLVKQDGLDKQFSEVALDVSGQAAGYLAMLPLTVTSSHAFYVNLEVLNELGLKPATTYSELKAQVDVLTAAGKETVIMDNQSDWVMLSCLFSMLAGRFGGAGWEKKILDGQAKFSDPDFVAALAFVKTLYDDKVIQQSSLSASYGDGLGRFANGAGAYFIDGDWRVGSFITDQTSKQAIIPVDRQPNFVMTVFPDIESAKLNKSTSTTLGTGYGISASIEAGSAKEAAAWKLIKYLVSTDIETFMVETGAISTPAITTVDISKLDLEPLQRQSANFTSQYTTGTVVLDSVFDAGIANVCNIGLQEIGMGSKSPEQVAQEVQKAFETWKAKQ
ncbi:MAG: extracellular solute-binding protein [Treponema sp.]|jgi:raffinose/stachyose/melibiose transport system substrate-binding protein|nr:extracellular solute-binding protein [Treponema sp.]